MTYSVQQIKFEFLSYIKEFGAHADDWFIGTCPQPEQTLFDSGLIDREHDIWLWKPALTPAAAAMVYRYFRGFGANEHPGTDPAGACVFLYRRGVRSSDAVSAQSPRSAASGS